MAIDRNAAIARTKRLMAHGAMLLRLSSHQCAVQHRTMAALQQQQRTDWGLLTASARVSPI
jgi:hypothetical protein